MKKVMMIFAVLNAFGFAAQATQLKCSSQLDQQQAVESVTEVVNGQAMINYGVVKGQFISVALVAFEGTAERFITVTSIASDKAMASAQGEGAAQLTIQTNLGSKIQIACKAE